MPLVGVQCAIQGEVSEYLLKDRKLTVLFSVLDEERIPGGKVSNPNYRSVQVLPRLLSGKGRAGEDSKLSQAGLAEIEDAAAGPAMK